MSAAPGLQFLHLHLVMMLLLCYGRGADRHPADALQSQHPLPSLRGPSLDIFRYPRVF